MDIGETGVVFIADASAESRTRDRVRRAVGAQGPVTARQLAAELDLTSAAVRRHLDALSEDGAIVERQVAGAGPRGRGRPARAYVLTDRGQEQLQTSYDDIATQALDYLDTQLGPGAVEDFARSHMARLETRLRRTVESVTPVGSDADDGALTARTEALALALSEQGFVASTRPVGHGTGLAGLQLCQGHCPVRSVAIRFPQFCDAETEVISRVLGVHVQRLATLAGGEHVCTTFVPTGPMSARPDATPDAHARPYRIPAPSEATPRERP